MNETKIDSFPTNWQDYNFFQIKKYFDEEKTWNQIIEVIDNYYNNIDQFDEIPENAAKNVFKNFTTDKYTNVRELYHLNIWIENIANREKESDFECIKKVKEEVFDLFDNPPWGASLIINFVTNGTRLSPHKDTTHSIALQLIGTAEWRIYENLEGPLVDQLPESDEYASLTMEPGDLIFVKKGVGHRVKALTPRASITMSLDTQSA